LFDCRIVLRLGLVGFGKWGRNYVQAALAAGNAQVTSVLLPEDSPTSELARASGLFVTSDPYALDVDAVIVAAHPSRAAEFCEGFIGRGIPVMVEKPAALDLVSAQRILDAASVGDAVVLVAHQHLFATAYEYIRAQAQSVNLTEVTTRAGGNGPHRDYSALWDYGPHDVAMIFGLTGSDPICINSKQETGPEGSHVFIDLTFEKGTQASCEIWNDRLPKSRFLSVRTSNTEWIYDDLDSRGRLMCQGRYLELPYEPALTRAVRHFVDAVEAGGTDDYRFGADWALRVARWLTLAQPLS